MSIENVRVVRTCRCGKITASKPGSTMHSRKCRVAQEAIQKGELPYSLTPAPTPAFNPIARTLQTFLAPLLEDISRAELGNQSAARRARLGLMRLSKEIKPIRAQLLQYAKQDRARRRSS